MKLWSSRMVVGVTATGVMLLGLLPGLVMAEASTIEYGDTLEGTVVSDSDPTQYEFEATAGDTVSIEAEQADMTKSIFLILNDGNGNQIATGGGFQGESGTIENFYIPYDGTFQIDVRGQAEQEFSITVERDSSAEDREVVFEDKFDDNSSDWETGGNSAISAVIDGGKYVIDADCQADNNSWFGAMDLNTDDSAPVFEKDFVAEVDVQIGEGEGNARVGWVFGVQPPGYQSLSVIYYETNDIGAGSYYLYRLFDPQTRDFNDTGDEAMPAALADGEMHHLVLQVSDGKVTSWVDEQLVAWFDAVDPVPGTIGLAGGCGVTDSIDTYHAEYDDLVVTQLKK